MTVSPRRRVRRMDVWTGLVFGLFGYLLAGCAFTYVGFFAGWDDPGDQMGAAVGVLAVIALVATVVVPTAALRARRERPGSAVGLLVGALIGLAMLTALMVPVARQINKISAHCPCEPIIEQLPYLSRD